MNSNAAPVRPPVWWEHPRRQLARARRLWPHLELPAPPTSVQRKTSTEMLLLHVPHSFDVLWGRVAAPTHYTKQLLNATHTIPDTSLRPAPNVPLRTEPQWLLFDSEQGRNEKPSTLWGNPDLAGLEVLSAMIMFPKWIHSWQASQYSPCMSGLQLNIHGSWRHVPYVARWDSRRRLAVGSYNSDGYRSHWVSPTVRNC